MTGSKNQIFSATLLPLPLPVLLLISQSELCRHLKSTMDKIVNKEMPRKPYAIDEDGEVIMILENANAPFAVWSENKKDVEISQESETKKEITKYEYRIQVSAKHLMLASPVFKKTLSGGWEESITLAKKGPVEIKVDSWDVGAFVIFYEDYPLSTQCHTA